MLKWIGAGIIGLSLVTAGQPAMAGKVGPGFKIGDGFFDGVNSSIAALADGGFVVTWTSEFDSGPSGPFYPNLIRRYTADGQPAEGQFDALQTGNDIDFGSSVIGLKIGGYTAFYTDTDGMYFSAQRYTKGGKIIGSTDYLTHFQAVAELENGGYVVISEDSPCSYCLWNAQGQRYTDFGIAIGSPIPIYSGVTPLGFSDPFTSVAALADGGFVVTWSDKPSSTGYDIFARRFSATGDSVGGTFQVNTYTTGDQTAPVAAGLANGSFVITWVSAGQDGSDGGIFVQRYNAGGGHAGAEFRVNTQTQNDQSQPAIASLKDGGFVVAWTGYDAPGSPGVYGQRYTASAAPVGTEFRVNAATAGNQQHPAVVGLTNGDFVVAISGPKGIVGQRYSAKRN